MPVELIDFGWESCLFERCSKMVNRELGFMKRLHFKVCSEGNRSLSMRSGVFRVPLPIIKANRPNFRLLAPAHMSLVLLKLVSRDTNILSCGAEAYVTGGWRLRLTSQQRRFLNILLMVHLHISQRGIVLDLPFIAVLALSSDNDLGSISYGCRSRAM